MDNIGKQVLLNVIGQLSDGMWENSRAMEHYWLFVRIEENSNGDVCIMISRDEFSDYHKNNKLKHMNPEQIREWFAKKARQIVNQESKDYPNRGIKCNSKCDVTLNYMYNHEDSNIKIKASDVYKTCKALRNFNY